MSKFSIAIHGGAGALSDVSEHRTALTEIINEAANLASNASAIDVVERTVVLLENHPLFNAGKGSVLNNKGEVECDAAIMNGTDLDAGAVAGVRGIKNPVALARKVMSDSEHVMLVGDGALEFAASVNAPTEQLDYFVVESRLKQLEEAKKAGKVVLDHSDTEEEKLGTVGAVAIDDKGNLAAATSTGGIVNKKFGRVGDSPVVGAGVYAENGLCAVSATGFGEQFLRTTLSKHIGDWMRYNHVDAQSAAQAGIDYLVEKVNGLGGVIVVDANYNIGIAHSTPLILSASICSGETGARLDF